MAWYHQTTNHFLSQYWPSSMTPCGITRPQWIKWHCFERSKWPGGLCEHHVELKSNILRANLTSRVNISWACFLSLAWSKLRICSANHRPGYWSNLPCDWLSTAWAYSEQDTIQAHAWWCTWNICSTIINMLLIKAKSAPNRLFNTHIGHHSCPSAKQQAKQSQLIVCEWYGDSLRPMDSIKSTLIDTGESWHLQSFQKKASL